MTSGKDAEEFLTFYKLGLIQTKYVLIKSVGDICLRVRNVGSPAQWRSLKRTDESADEIAVAKRVPTNLDLQTECRC